MNPYPNSPHRVFVMDVEDPLAIFQNVLVDYCEEWNLVNETSLFLATLNFLAIRDNLNESCEAMEIHANEFCFYEHTPYAVNRLREAIRIYMRTMHALFVENQLYQNDMHLAYEFGGWLSPFNVILVPHTHAAYYPQARSSIVSAEPYGTNPFDLIGSGQPNVFNKIYHVGLLPEEIPY